MKTSIWLNKININYDIDTMQEIAIIFALRDEIQR